MEKIEESAKPLLSIIIPCYNVERYIQETLDSIVFQKGFDNCELILIDDCSKDSTFTKISSYANCDNIIISRNLINKGVSATRNKGIEISSGLYLLFVDGDDCLAEGAINRLLELASSKADMVSFGFQIVFENKKTIHNGCVSADNKLYTSRDFLIKYFKRKILQHLCSFICKKEIVNQYCIRFDENTFYAEDQEFQIRCMFYSKQVFYIKDELFLYRIRSGSAMTSNFTLKRLTALKAFERLDQLLKDDVTYRYFRNYALFNYYSMLRLALKGRMSTIEFAKFNTIRNMRPHFSIDNKVGISVNILKFLNKNILYFFLRKF